jgi:hypothetical protein
MESRYFFERQHRPQKTRCLEFSGAHNICRNLLQLLQKDFASSMHPKNDPQTIRRSHRYDLLRIFAEAHCKRSLSRQAEKDVRASLKFRNVDVVPKR